MSRGWQWERLLLEGRSPGKQWQKLIHSYRSRQEKASQNQACWSQSQERWPQHHSSHSGWCKVRCGRSPQWPNVHQSTQRWVWLGEGLESMWWCHAMYLSKEDDPLELIREREVKVENSKGDDQGHNAYHQEQHNPICTTFAAAVAEVKGWSISWETVSTQLAYAQWYQCAWHVLH